MQVRVAPGHLSNLMKSFVSPLLFGLRAAAPEQMAAIVELWPRLTVSYEGESVLRNHAALRRFSRNAEQSKASFRGFNIVLSFRPFTKIF